MKTSYIFAAAVLLIHSAEAGFGKTPDIALVTKAKSRCRFSVTGMQGLDHNYVQEVVVAVKPEKETDLKKQSHRDEAFLEHHPYASGLFTIDPHHQQV
jgi:hypothetical protein